MCSKCEENSDNRCDDCRGEFYLEHAVDHTVEECPGVFLPWWEILWPEKAH